MEDVLELPSNRMWFKGSKLPVLPPASYPTHENTGLCNGRYLLISRPLIYLIKFTLSLILLLMAATRAVSDLAQLRSVSSFY